MRLLPLLLVVVCIAVLFTGLSVPGLIDVREARDAEVARELVQSEEVLTPLYAHEPFFDKPILAYAPEAAARLTGPDFDARSRWLRAIAATLLVILIASIAAQHFGARAAWCSGLVLATTLGLPLASHTDGTQIWATLLGWLGCAAFADALFGRRAGREPRLTVGYGALAAAFVVAGPLPALWPFAGAALYLAIARDRRGWRELRPWPGLALILGIALPWYGAMIERHGGEFLRHAGFFPYGAGERRAWYAGFTFMVSFLVLGFFPWCALLPTAIQHAAISWLARRGAVPRAPRRGANAAANPSPAIAREAPIHDLDRFARERHEEGVAHFFIACLLAALVPIAFYPGAPLPAVLPALPAAALLCGRFLDHLFEDGARLASPLMRSLLMLAVLGTALSVPTTALAGRLGGAAPDLRLVGTALFVASWLPLLAGLLRRPRVAAALVLLPVAVVGPLVTLRLLPALEGFLGARPVAMAMNRAAPPYAALVVIEPAPPSLRLYVRHNLVMADTLVTSLDRNRAADGLTYVAFRPARESEVARSAGGPIEILMRTDAMVLARVHR